jgi:hypothetical protein
MDLRHARIVPENRHASGIGAMARELPTGRYLKHRALEGMTERKRGAGGTDLMTPHIPCGALSGLAFGATEREPPAQVAICGSETGPTTPGFGHIISSCKNRAKLVIQPEFRPEILHRPPATPTPHNLTPRPRLQDPTPVSSRQAARTPFDGYANSVRADGEPAMACRLSHPCVILYGAQ